MSKLLFLVPVFSIAVACNSQSSPSNQTGQVESAGFETITRVVDGDTFVIAANWSPYQLEWRIRVRGIDTPEKGHRARCERERQLSARAQALSENLIRSSGSRVRLQRVAHDKYGGRLDADIMLVDGRSLGQELLREGLARPYNGNGPKPNWCN